MMKLEKITETVNGWGALTSKVLDLKEFGLSDIQELLKETYKILKAFYKDKVVPKEISRLLLCMNEFLYFSSMMEDKEVPMDFFHYQAINCIVSAIKNGFFDGRFEHKFLAAHVEKLYEIDMGQNGVMDYLQAVKNKTCKEHTGIKLIG